MRFLLVSLVFAGLAAPVSSARDVMVVPPPPAVLEQPLAAAGDAAEAGVLGAAGQTRAWVFRHAGQQLELSVTRVNGSGMVVLSMPDDGSAALLPQVPLTKFRDAAAAASGRSAGHTKRLVSSSYLAR